MDEYYVYVYIDPRNHEEFYYGKGRGSRRYDHLNDAGDSEKAKRIREIRRAGLEPIIRVIASRLAENEALLIETTLIWKLGRFTTNLASGHFADKFRPPNNLHLELSGFDFQNHLYYYNVGEGPDREHRDWEDYIRFGFISAGQGRRWGDAMKGFNEGDVVAAYLTGKGYVGVGKITKAAEMIREVYVNGRRLLDLPLKCTNMDANGDSVKKSEYVALVKWIKAFTREEAKWVRNAGLFTAQKVKASLDRQTNDRQARTIDFIEREFDVDLRNLIV